MPVRTTYYEVRDPDRIVREFKQTPIFVGTATKKVVVSRKPGVFSLAIPTPEVGTKWREDLFESKIKYWRIYGKANISLIAPQRYALEMNNFDLSYISSPSDLTRCNLFIKYNNTIIFSSPLHSPEFKVINGKFYINDCTLFEKLPLNLPTLECILAAPTTVENTAYSTHDNLVELLPTFEQLTADQFNSFLETDYIFYYDIVDYRWTRLKSTDEVPEEFKYNAYNKLGLAAILHRRASDADMTLFSVPAETFAAMEHVLAEIELNPYKYGYALVPLWVNPEINNMISQFVTHLEANRIGFQIAYLTRTLQSERHHFGENNFVESDTEETSIVSGYGYFYGEEYGRNSD